MGQSDQMFFALLRSAMMGEGFEATPTEAEWTALYQTARKQSVAGVVYTAATLGGARDTSGAAGISRKLIKETESDEDELL